MDPLENGLSQLPSSTATTTAGSGSGLLSTVAGILSQISLPSQGVEFFPSACTDTSGAIGALADCVLLGSSTTSSVSTQDSPVVATPRPLKDNFVSPPDPLFTIPSIDPDPPVIVGNPPPPDPPVTISFTVTDSTILSSPSPTSDTFIGDPSDSISDTPNTTSTTALRSTQLRFATDNSDGPTSGFTATSDVFTSNSDTDTPSPIIDVPSETQSSVPSIATASTPIFTPVATTIAVNTNSESTTSFTSFPDATAGKSSNENTATQASQFNDIKVPVLVGGIVGFVGVALLVAVLFIWIARRRRRIARNRLSVTSSFFARDNRWSTFSGQSSTGNMNTISHFYNPHDNYNSTTASSVSRDYSNV